MENISKTIISNASDETLIQQFKNGSKDAFGMLYHRYLPNVYRRVRFTVPADDVDDVTQEIFIAALKSLPGFRGEAQFSTWLRTLTNNKISEFYRKRSRKQEPLLAPLSDALGRTEDHTSTNLEKQVIVQRAFQELSESHREVILLRFAEGLQFSEISQVTGQSLDGIKSLFRRAVIALRSNLSKQEEDEYDEHTK
ncbi:MAG: sigma-70 family RNA polymerase sigma factor [Chloroflexi bacterium]|nr:sigma-70 family RNA polymerase sigma factor [Chloroflexota bacterium]